MSPIDKRQARLAFERAAASYDRVAFLQRETGERLLERLDYIRIEPRRILDIGCGTGVATEALLKRYRHAELIALDFALPMLARTRRRGRWLRRPRCVCGDAERLPLASASVDLVFSNATFQWCDDLPRLFSDLCRVLRPGGMLLFSSFGPDTLKELRAAWAAVDGASHVSPFRDMHELGDAMVGAQLADPVVDAEWVTVTYRATGELMRDLKALGAHNVTRDRPRGLTGKERLGRMSAAYEAWRVDGRLPATYEIVYGHAWAPAQRVTADGVVIPFEGLRRRR